MRIVSVRMLGTVPAAIRPVPVSMPKRKIPSAIQASRVSILQNPHLHATATGIKSCRLLANFQEDILNNVFRFAVVPQDSQANCQDKTPVSKKKNPQCLARAALEVFDKVRVGECREVAVGHFANLGDEDLTRIFSGNNRSR